MNNFNRLWKTVSVLSSVGIILALYLLYEYLAPVSSEICNINESFNCHAVTKGALAEFFGLPVALYGLLGYIFIFYSAIKRNKKLLLGMTAFGMVFCLRLTILEIFVVKVYCPVCLACQAIMFTLFLIGIYIYTNSEGEMDTSPTPGESLQ